MEAFEIALLVLAMLAIVAAFWSMVYVMNFMRRTGDWIDNHVPLGDSARNARLEAAMRDVEERFNVCATCGVDNVHYRIFCVLCGSPVEKIAVDQASSPTVLLPRAELHATTWDTVRQRRARARRDWVRTSVGEGKLRWTPSAATHRYTHYPAYVLSFKETKQGELVIRVDEGDDREVEHEDDLVGNRTEDDVEHVEFVPVSKANEQLQSQVSRCTMAVEITTCVDPASQIVPVDAHIRPSRSSGSALTMRDVLELADQPFPERLAIFVTQTTMLQNKAGRLSLKVQREDLFHESIALLAAIPPHVVSSSIRLKFLEEQGIDAGGVYREWFLLLNEAMVSPTSGIFICFDPQNPSLFLNPHSQDLLGEHHLVYFLSAGRWLGRALLEGNVTGYHLALPLLKIILGQPVAFEDLEFFDPESYQNLKWLLENDDVISLGLNFTVVENLPDGKCEVVELIPGGVNIDVSDINKDEYVDRKFHYLLFERVSTQLFAFLKGVHDVIPMELLRLFDAEELDYLLSGSDEIDVDDWEKHSKFTADLIDHSVRGWFWELVREMPHEHRRRLLQYSTGASRVPLAGFGALTSYDGRLCPFTLKGVKLKHESYIRSHACFNTLDLPHYRDKETLRRMLEAIVSDEHQGFTIA